MNEPKVMLLIATSILGGPGKGIFQLLDRYKQKKISYVLVAYKLKGAGDTEFIKLAKNKGYTLEIIEQQGLFNLDLFRSAKKILEKYDVNLLQSHGYKSHLIALYLHYLRNIKWVSFIHGWSTENLKVRIYSIIELLVVRFSNLVVAVSPSICTVLRRWQINNFTTILNAIDKNELQGAIGGLELRRKLGINELDFVIGTVGRLSPEKGHKYLIDAVANIQHPGIKVLIVGDGPLKSELEKQCNERNMRDRVIFSGHITNIRDYYQAMNILVLPSLKEGLPNVVLEAMVMGVPVISTDVGGVREIITDAENGWIIEPENVHAIQERLEQILLDKNSLSDIGKRLQLTLYPKFCPDSRADKVIDVYNKLLN